MACLGILQEHTNLPRSLALTRGPHGKSTKSWSACPPQGSGSCHSHGGIQLEQGGPTQNEPYGMIHKAPLALFCAGGICIYLVGQGAPFALDRITCVVLIHVLYGCRGCASHLHVCVEAAARALTIRITRHRACR